LDDLRKGRNSGTPFAYVGIRMNENEPIRGFSEEQSNALKKKLRSLLWKPEAVMRETVLIQRLREIAVTGDAEG
jgi:hypothetical protein